MSLSYLLLISILGWGIGSFCYKGANNNMHPIMVSTVATIIYSILIPIYFLLLKFNYNINIKGLIYCFMGTLCMCAGSMSYFYAIRNGAVGQITALTALYPSVTFLLSYMFMGEPITIKKMIGIILAFISAYFLSL